MDILSDKFVPIALRKENPMRVSPFALKVHPSNLVPKAMVLPVNGEHRIRALDRMQPTLTLAPVTPERPTL